MNKWYLYQYIYISTSIELIIYFLNYTNVCTVYIQYLQQFLLESLDFFKEFKKKWDQVESTLPVTDTSTDTPFPEAERLVTTASVTPNKCIALPIFSQIHIIYSLIFQGPGVQIQMSKKSTDL
jgi:hypothetical protein